MSEAMTVLSPPSLVEPPDTAHRPGLPHRWTNAEFERMVPLGLLREGDRTFLWDGEVLSPMPEDPEHSHAQDNLRELFGMRFPRMSWTISPSHPVILEEGFLPQPDLALLFGPRASYRGRKPRPVDVAILIEVSHTSYSADAVAFLGRYAKANIPQYWIVNIRARRIEVYTDPDSEGQSYRVRRDYGLDATVPLTLNVEGVVSEFEAIAVRDVLQDSLDEA